MTATADRFAGAAEALLKQAELSPGEMAERFEAALDVDRWRRLVPFASIEEKVVSGDDARIAPPDALREKSRLDEDGYFCLKQAPSISAFLEASLGTGFLQNTVVWAHWIPDAKGVAGWRPHDDYRRGGDTFLSLWIPLSEATMENGCMFLVPDRRSRAALPPFRTRLFAIVKALREYTKFEPLLLRHLPLAERIFEETSPGE